MVSKKVKLIEREVVNINKGLNSAFSKLGSELSEHLDTINANTSEIEALTQAILILEQKVDKLNERIDELSMSDFKEEHTLVYDLSIKEQEVFVSLYTSEKFLSAKEIARSIGRTEENTNLILKRLINKKIPIQNQNKENCLVYALDNQFKQLQAKQNVVQLHKNVLNEMQC